MTNSKLKTWLRRNGFRCEGRPRQAMRACNGYVERSGRKFRFRDNVVDISCPIEDFDRWANSTEHTVPTEVFIKTWKNFTTRILPRGTYGNCFFVYEASPIYGS